MALPAKVGRRSTGTRPTKGRKALHTSSACRLQAESKQRQGRSPPPSGQRPGRVPARFHAFPMSSPQTVRGDHLYLLANLK